MKIETLDQLEKILGEVTHGLEFESLIEAVGNDDDSRIAGDIYRILFLGKPEQLESQVEALRQSFAVYFGLDETESEKIDYAEPAYGNFSAEKEVKIA